MTKVWMGFWWIAAVGCAAPIDGTRSPEAGVPVIDAGATPFDAPTARDDGPSGRDVPVVRDVRPRRDAPTPWDAPVPSGPFALVMKRYPDCFFGQETDSTVFDDGRVRRTGVDVGLDSQGRKTYSAYDISVELPGGVDDVRRARLALEATGLVDVPEGSYHVDEDRCESVLFHYRRGERVLTWGLTPGSNDPLPPPALEAAFRVVDDLLATAR